MDKLEREKLKHDKFVAEVGHTVEYVSGHRKQVLTYLAVGIGLIVLGIGGMIYRAHRQTVRQAALTEALRVQEGQVGPGTNEFIKLYATQEEKDKAAQAAFQDVVNKFDGSEEAEIARYYLGANAADKGKLDDAVKYMQHVADHADKEYASQAKLSLAQLYSTQGKTADAEKLYRSLIDNPTVMVSKEQATIALARMIAPARPADARKLLEPLRAERSAVSRVALSALSELPR